MGQSSRRGRAPSPGARPHADAETGPARPDPCRMPIAIKPARAWRTLTGMTTGSFPAIWPPVTHGTENGTPAPPPVRSIGTGRRNCRSRSADPAVPNGGWPDSGGVELNAELSVRARQRNALTSYPADTSRVNAGLLPVFFLVDRLQRRYFPQYWILFRHPCK